MTHFSEDQMHRPLFEEPTEDIERVDAWEEPLGFMIGGMANTSLQQLGEQYFDAAILLTEIIQNHQWEDYRLANPTLFLYRHSIELLLKAAMGGTAKTHSLDELADAFVAFVKREFDTDVPSWIRPLRSNGTRNNGKKAEWPVEQVEGLVTQPVIHVYCLLSSSLSLEPARLKPPVKPKEMFATAAKFPYRCFSFHYSSEATSSISCQPYLLRKPCISSGSNPKIKIFFATKSL